MEPASSYAEKAAKYRRLATALASDDHTYQVFSTMADEYEAMAAECVARETSDTAD